MTHVEVKPSPESPLAGRVSCRWGGAATARHAECRGCVPPEWKGWEKGKVKTDDEDSSRD